MEEVISYFQTFGIVVAIAIIIGFILYIINMICSIRTNIQEKRVYDLMEEDEQLSIKIKNEQLSNIKKANVSRSTYTRSVPTSTSSRR